MGMLEILRKNKHNPEKLEECMDKMQVSADHLLALVNDVLDMNKLETNQIRAENEPFDMEVLMREVAVLMNPLLEKNQITHRAHRKNIQHTALKGSPLQLRQIMLTCSAMRSNTTNRRDPWIPARKNYPVTEKQPGTNSESQIPVSA